MARGRQSKLFYDLDAAKAYGAEVDFIAEEVTIPTGKSGMPKSVFVNNYQKEISGEYHYIEQDQGNDCYYVRYNIVPPRNSSQADMVVAERQISEYLDQKYQEHGPDIGTSRA